MKRCIIDTNVMVTANKALSYQDNDDVYSYPQLITNCINALLDITKKDIYVVFDVDNEIFNEYKRYLRFEGQPGVGDMFFKWMHDHRYRYPDTEVKLHKTDSGYEEFPVEMEAADIDPGDKKFFAVSNAHASKPDVLEAVDTKWWNWVEAAKRCGITIQFMDEQYMRDHNPIAKD